MNLLAQLHSAVGPAGLVTLGLEVVLPDGRIWHGLRALRKDNTGYDLKHLFIGAEGTLGVITALPAFVDRAGAALRRALPGIRLVTYGHVGDGNLHYNLSKPAGTADAQFLARADELTRIVHDEVAALDGSISAEHGLGQSKNETIARYKPAIELSLMREIKRLLDPVGLMNPGKVLPTS